MKNTLLIFSLLLISATSCKKKDKDFAPTREALQGNWTQDSSWTYEIKTDVDPHDTLFLTKEYVTQSFVIEGSHWYNLTSDWEQELDFHDGYLLIGGTRYNIEQENENQFSLTMIPQGEFKIHYTRWFSR